MKKTLTAFILSALVSSSLANPTFAASVEVNNTLTCAGYTVEFKNHDPALIATSNLQVSEPQVLAMDINASCAVVVWNTDKLSTSQVIFAKEKEEYTLDILNKTEKEYWGYPHGSLQNSKAEVYHVMIIQGLEKGASYRLRAVSRPHSSALPFMSPEFKFSFEDAHYDKNQSNTQKSLKNPVNTGLDKSSLYDPNLQKSWAKSVNRTYAPSHSNGKFVSGAGSSASKSKSVGTGETTRVEKTNERKLTPPTENDLVEVIGAANAGDNLLPLWDRVKSFFKSLLGIGGQMAPEEEQNSTQGAANGSEILLENDENSQSASVVVNISSVKDVSQNIEEKSAAKEAAESSNQSENIIVQDKEEEILAATEGKDNIATSVEAGMDALAKSSVAAASSAQNIFERFGILALIIPVLIIISALYLVQWSLSKTYEWFRGKTLIFWMSAFALVALIFAIIRNVPLALSFLAFFLITLAWHLFNIAVSDIDEIENIESVDRVDIDKD